MEKQELQKLLSLSILSLFGPKYDSDYLNQIKFYKSLDQTTLLLELNLNKESDLYKVYQKNINLFLDYLGVTDQASYHGKINELISGSTFSKNMNKMMQLGKMMSIEQRIHKKTILINKHPYPKLLFDEIMHYELHWPKKKLLAYDIANGIMLLRLGITNGYLTESEQQIFLEQFLHIVKNQVDDIKEYGIECEIGRKLHIFYLNHIRNIQVTDQEPWLSIAYYGIWQYISFEKLFQGRLDE